MPPESARAPVWCPGGCIAGKAPEESQPGGLPSRGGATNGLNGRPGPPAVEASYSQGTPAGMTPPGPAGGGMDPQGEPMGSPSKLPRGRQSNGAGLGKPQDELGSRIPRRGDASSGAGPGAQPEATPSRIPKSPAPFGSPSAAAEPKPAALAGARTTPAGAPASCAEEAADRASQGAHPHGAPGRALAYGGGAGCADGSSPTSPVHSTVACNGSRKGQEASVLPHKTSSGCTPARVQEAEATPPTHSQLVALRHRQVAVLQRLSAAEKRLSKAHQKAAARGQPPQEGVEGGAEGGGASGGNGGGADGAGGAGDGHASVRQGRADVGDGSAGVGGGSGAVGGAGVGAGGLEGAKGGQGEKVARSGAASVAGLGSAGDIGGGLGKAGEPSFLSPSAAAAAAATTTAAVEAAAVVPRAGTPLESGGAPLEVGVQEGFGGLLCWQSLPMDSRQQVGGVASSFNLSRVTCCAPVVQTTKFTT